MIYLCTKIKNLNIRILNIFSNDKSRYRKRDFQDHGN